MHKVLLCILFAAFALMMMFIVLAEATLEPDATDQLALEAGPVKTLDVEFVAVTVASSPVYEHPDRNYIPRDVEAELTFTTNEALAVGRSRGTGVRPGGWCPPALLSKAKTKKHDSHNLGPHRPGFFIALPHRNRLRWTP